MAERTLEISVQARVDGFAATVLDGIAEQLDEAAARCREQARAIREAQEVTP